MPLEKDIAADYELESKIVFYQFKKSIISSKTSIGKRRAALDYIAGLLIINSRYGEHVKHLDEFVDGTITRLKKDFNISDRAINKVFLSHKKINKNIGTVYRCNSKELELER
jgi:hypothetical protein